MRQKARKKSCEPKTLRGNQVTNQSLYSEHNPRAGLRARSSMRRREVSYQVTLLQISLEIPGPVDMFYPA